MTVGQNCRYDISTGYQYGHIPWADADITVLVDERGGVKFCLQEICAKVRTQCSNFERALQSEHQHVCMKSCETRK